MEETRAIQLQFQRWYRYRNRGGSTVTVPESTTVGATNTRVGVSNMLWRQQILRGINATTPFQGTKFSILKLEPTDWEVTRTVPATGYVEYNALVGYWLVFSFPPANTNSLTVADANAKRKLVKRLFELRRSFAGSTFVAELADTLRMVKRPLRGLREGLDHYHKAAKKAVRGLPKGSGAARKAVADTWLEAQFGLIPLSNDVDDALEQLSRISKPNIRHFRVKGWESMPVSVSTDVHIGRVSVDHVYNVATLTRQEVAYYGALRVTPPSGWTWSSWGFNTRDFLPAVHEAIPWSFAVDYFTNIGDIVSAYSGILSDIAWCGKTTRQVAVKESINNRLVTSSFIAPPIYKLLDQRVGSFGITKLQSTVVTRSAADIGSLYPSFYLRVPGAGSLKWLNLAALATLRVI